MSSPTLSPTQEQDAFIALLGASLDGDGDLQAKCIEAITKLTAARDAYKDRPNKNDAFLTEINKQIDVVTKVQGKGLFTQAIQAANALTPRFEAQKTLDGQSADYTTRNGEVTALLTAYKQKPFRDDEFHGRMTTKQQQAGAKAGTKDFAGALVILNAMKDTDLPQQDLADTQLKQKLDDNAKKANGLTVQLKNYTGTPGSDATFVKAMTAKILEAQTHRAGRKIDDAERVLTEVEQAINARLGQPPSESETTLSPKQQKEKEIEDRNKKGEADLDLKMAQVGDVLSPAIKKIMEDHRGSWKKEADVFKGYRWFDDLLFIKKEDERQKKIEAMLKAIDAVKQRRIDLSAAITSNPNFNPKPNKRGEVGETDSRKQEIKDAVEVCRQFYLNMPNHVPEAFWQEEHRFKDITGAEQSRGLKDRLDILKKVAGKKPDERRKLIDDALRGMTLTAEQLQLLNDPTLKGKPLPQDKTDPDYDKIEKRLEAEKVQKTLDAESKAFHDAVGAGSLKPSELTAFYFDDPVRSPTPEQLKAVYAANDAIIKRAYEIHDLGGKVEDVEKALAHIPEEFWPPQFIEELAAWRKVEREMAEERVQEYFADPKKMTGLDKFNTIAGITGLLGDLATIVSSGGNAQQYLGSGSNPTEGPTIFANEKIGEDLLFINQEFKDMGKAGTPLAKAIDAGNLDSLDDEQVLGIIGRLANITSRMKSIGDLANSTSSAAVNFCSVCPILGAVGSGIDLTLISLELKKICDKRNIAKKQLEQVEFDYFTGKNCDKAMLNALKNEKEARDRQVTKKSVEVASKTIQFAGYTSIAVGGGTGVGAGVGAVLKIVGKSIELGNKVVFSCIDWSIATNAMALLKEAQAGNPVARVEIFKNCGLYAKMYICCAARDGDKVAKEFIIDRGLTEGDLTKAMALKVLREKLLKDTEQKDESKNTNLGGVLVENMISGSARKIGDKGGKGKQEPKVLKKNGPEYNPDGWNPPGTTAFTVEEWEAEKKKAIANGLFDSSTGITAALKAAVPAYTAAKDAFDADGTMPAQLADRKKKGLKAMTALQAVMAAIGKYEPLTNLGKTYPKMIDYAALIRAEASRRYNVVNQWLFDKAKVNGKDRDWKPDHNRDIDPAEWKTNWTTAVEKCLLPEDDQGVGKALKALEAATNSPDRTGQNLAKKRKANLAMRDRLKETAEALNRCDSQCGEFPQVVAYIRALLQRIIDLSQAANRELMQAAWTGTPKGKSEDFKFSSNGWNTTFASALGEGFVSGADQGLGKAIKEWETAAGLLAGIKPSEKKKRAQAHSLVLKKLAEVTKITDKVALANLDMHQDMADYLDYLKTTAFAKCASAREQISANTFTYDVTSLETAAWTRTYTDATKEGAVPENKDADKLLSGALESFRKANDLYSAEKKPDKKLVKALAVKSTLSKITQAITKVGNMTGYEHKQMVEYLAKLQTLVDERLKPETPLVAVLNCQVDDSKFGKPQFVWEHKSWTEIKKNAVSLGLLQNKSTGFGKALDASKAAFNAWNAASEDKRPELRDKAFDQVTAIKKFGAEVLRGLTKNKKVLAYLDDVVTEADRRLAAMKRVEEPQPTGQPPPQPTGQQPPTGQQQPPPKPQAPKKPDPADIVYDGGLGANPTLYFLENSAGGYNLKVASTPPGGEWGKVEQFCAYLAAHWLANGHAGQLKFENLDKEKAVKAVFKWGQEGGGFAAQEAHATATIGGNKVGKADVALAATNKTHPTDTLIWYGNDGHVKGAVKLADDNYDVYEPNDGSVTKMTTDAFAIEVGTANVCIVK